MKIHSFRIQNFKSFKDITIEFNPTLNIFTGVNNSGKTTILEALALWKECFDKLVTQARKAVKDKYSARDFILGPTNNKYFGFSDINSVRSPNFEDLFRDLNKKNKIKLEARLKNEFGETIDICFKISDAVGKYKIELENFSSFDFTGFNNFFNNLPEAIETYYASPVAFIELEEDFVTDPQIKDAIKNRKSSSVIRNRIYRLYQSPLFQKFQGDLSYILYENTTARLVISNRSDIQKDPRVKISYTIGNDNVEKDIALLGSGTLQAIEILLNIYQQSEQNKDINLILLDEPDSHIHRDIQRRLITVLTRFGEKNQIFITTHNESFIRSTSLEYLFHVHGKSEGPIKCLYEKDIPKIAPRFSGLYPSSLTPVIKSLGSENGLDFINAIESDRIIFVEGEDDARVIHRLLQEYPGNHNRKFMFWVLGGVTEIFTNIRVYRTFFSKIKNDRTLWDKSYLIFDKDQLTDEHAQVISEKIKTELMLLNHFIDAYTQESVLLTEPAKLANLLALYLAEKHNQKITEIEVLVKALQDSYEQIEIVLRERFSPSKLDNFYREYKGRYVDKTKIMFNTEAPVIEFDDVKLLRHLEIYYSSAIDSGKYFKLLTKTDVQDVINSALKTMGIQFVFDIEYMFYDLITLIDKSVWFDEWDYLKEI